MNTKSVVAVAPELPTTPPVLKAVDAEVDIEILRVVPQKFSICDERSANWLVRKIIAARDYGQHVKEWAELERRRAEREEQTLLFLFGKQIEAWTKDQVEILGGRKKSISLPGGGTLGFRKKNPLLVVDDEVMVIKWAKLNLTGAIEICESLRKSVLNDHFNLTGEVPPDCHVEPAAERFYIS
jgi:hypothetical protein